MASFGDRPKELLRRFTEEKASFSDAEATKIQQVLRDYESVRNDALSALVDIAGDSGDDEKKSDYNDRFNTAREAVMKSLTGMLDGLSTPSADAVLFRTQAAIEEASFFGALQGANVGGARDVLLQFKLRIKDMKNQLDAAWATTDSENLRIMEIERQCTKDMNSIISKTVEDGISTFASLSSASYGVVEKLKGFPALMQTIVVESVRGVLKVAQQALPSYDPLANKDISDVADYIPKMSDPGKELFALAKSQGMEAKELAALAPYLARNPSLVVSDYIDDAIKKVSGVVVGQESASSVVFLVKMAAECTKYSYGLLSPWAAAREKYTSQMPSEGQVLVCFSKWRKQADEFLVSSGIDAAHAYAGTVKEGLQQFMSACSTDGLQHDAYTLLSLIWDALSRRITDMESFYGYFINANQGRFFGGISSETLSRILDIEHWNTEIEGLVGMALDQRVKQWREQVMAIDSNFDSAWEQVQGAVANLPVSFQYAFKSRLEAYYSDVKSQLAAVKSKSVEVIDQTAEIVQPDTIRKSLDRSALRQALSA